MRAYAQQGSDWDIIVVLDGCTDRTGLLARSVAAENPWVHVVELARQTGKGSALVAGMAAAKAPIVAFVDADGATEPGELRRLCGLVGGAEAVIGSRWLPGADVVVEQPLVRRAASRVFNLIVGALFGLKVSDTQCGAKAFRAAALAPVLEEVETSNFAFDVDLLLGLKRRGAAILEVPTRWHDVRGSKVALLSGAIKMLLAVLRLRLRHSRFSAAIPAFDRVFPTQPLRAPAVDGGF